MQQHDTVLHLYLNAPDQRDSPSHYYSLYKFCTGSLLVPAFIFVPTLGTNFWASSCFSIRRKFSTNDKSMQINLDFSGVNIHQPAVAVLKRKRKRGDESQRKCIRETHSSPWRALCSRKIFLQFTFVQNRLQNGTHSAFSTNIWLSIWKLLCSLFNALWFLSALETQRKHAQSFVRAPVLTLNGYVRRLETEIPRT